MASTSLNELGVHPDVIELQLAHLERNNSRRPYNHSTRLPDRRSTADIDLSAVLASPVLQSGPTAVGAVDIFSPRKQVGRSTGVYVANGSASTFTATIQDVPLSFETAPGVFSPRNIDAGSATLLANVQLEASDKVLDLGCGYGAMGIYAAKVIGPERVYMLLIRGHPPHNPFQPEYVQ